MALRIGFIAALVGLYLLGLTLAAANSPAWVIAILMGAVFFTLVAAMYLRVLPALLALPILAIALASIAGMSWHNIFTTVVQDGSFKLGKWIAATILGSMLAQIVEKTGIAHTAIKKTAELGGDRPFILAVLLTLVTAVLFTTLGGLGAVIMVATIVIPILLSLGLRPLYVACIFLIAVSLGGIFNVTNWEGYKSTLGMSNISIMLFAVPFAVLMLITTFLFLFIEGKRMGKARFKAVVAEPEAPPQFVPWYALLTPIVPLVPVLFFSLLPFFVKPQPAVTVHIAPALRAKAAAATYVQIRPDTSVAENPVAAEKTVSLKDGERTVLTEAGKAQGTFVLELLQSQSLLTAAKVEKPLDIAPYDRVSVTVQPNRDTGQTVIVTHTLPLKYDFPIIAALLLGILYGAVATWRRGVSTVQLVTKSAFDGITAVGPALALLIGIGMVLNATISPEVSGVIGPLMAKVVPQSGATGPGAFIHYVIIFAILAPLALYRGPLNLYGMGIALMGVLQPLMPSGSIMAVFMSSGMIQGVSDPTNTSNVWLANYTNTDVQDILKRTLPYMWILAVAGLIMSAIFYYTPLAHAFAGMAK